MATSNSTIQYGKKKRKKYNIKNEHKCSKLKIDSLNLKIGTGIRCPCEGAKMQPSLQYALTARPWCGL